VHVQRANSAKEVEMSKRVMRVAAGVLAVALGPGVVLAQSQDQGAQGAQRAQQAQPAPDDKTSQGAPSEAGKEGSKEGSKEASKPRPAVQVTVGGQKTTVTEGPVWFEWTGSESLTRAGVQAVRESSLQVAASSAEAAVRVTVTGELVLIGGPRYHRGAKASLAEVVDRANKIDSSRGPDSSDVRRIAGDAAIAGAVVQRAGLGSTLSSVALADVFGSIVKASGLSGWLNTKLVGDPRGTCFSGCATWNDVKQTAYIVVRVQRGDQAAQEARIMSQANDSQLVVDEVVQRGLDAVWALFPVPTAKAATGAGAVALN